MFAKSSLEICKRGNLPEILATAYEAVARAYAVAEDHVSASKYLRLARNQLETLDLKAEDRKAYAGQIDDTERLIAR